MSTRPPVKTPPRKTPLRVARPAAPIKPMSTSAKLKVANTFALKAGLAHRFKLASSAMTWGFNAVNDPAMGTLKMQAGVASIDFNARRVEILALTPQASPRPLKLDLKVLKGHFYVVDVYCKPSTNANFFATSNRTTSGGNFTTQYSVTLESGSQHFVFVLQAVGSADGGHEWYRLDIGADQPWSFEKIELTKVE
jgi:hypothetical protein